MSNDWYDIDCQWVESEDSQWGFTTGPVVPGREGLNQIWTDDTYVYAATTSGLDVIDIETEQRVSFATNATGYTTVWTSSDQVFLGSSAGVKVLNKSSIGPVEISSAVYNYQNAPLLPDDNVNYIHGNSNKLICCTVDGVAIIRRDSGYVTKTTISGANKCFVTPEHDYYYYTVSGVGGWQLNRLNGNYSDWTTPDVVYTTGSGFLETALSITDFYVTEHTSTSGVNNTLFVVTDYGIHIYDEGTEEEIIYKVQT
jgi:hypothetical protein